MSEESPNNNDDYSALRNLLNNHLIYLSYLPYKTKCKDFRKYLISWIFLFLLTLWGVRYYIFLSIPSDNVLVYYLCDANFMLGTARQPLNILLGAWVSTTAILGYYFKLTQFYPPKFYRSWLKLSSILSTHYYHGAGPFHKEVLLLYWFVYGNTILTGLTTFSFNLVWFFYSPQKYWIIGSIFATLHAIVAYYVSFVFAARSLIQAFHLYIYGKFFQYITIQLNQDQIKTINGKKTDVEFRRLFALTKCLKEMKRNNNFHSLFLRFVFIVSFFSSVYILYCIFFTNLPIPVKFALAVWGTFYYLNLVYTFLASIYARNWFQSLLRKEFNFVAKQMNSIDSLRLLNYSQHIQDCATTKIFGGLQFDSHTFLIVALEAVSFLLLLVANN